MGPIDVTRVSAFSLVHRPNNTLYTPNQDGQREGEGVGILICVERV